MGSEKMKRRGEGKQVEKNGDNEKNGS